MFVFIRGQTHHAVHLHQEALITYTVHFSGFMATDTA